MIVVCRAWISIDGVASLTLRARGQQPPTAPEGLRALQMQTSRVGEAQTQTPEVEDNIVTNMVQEREEIYNALSASTRKTFTVLS